MIGKLWTNFGRRATFMLDAETAHGLAIAGLKSGGISGGARHIDPRLNCSIAGLNFANPLGMAAGFDKNAEVPDALLNLGFGFSEVGTITPLAQAGNPKPRIFRLTEDDAAMHLRLNVLKSVLQKSGIVGVNVGANKDSDDRANDYVLGIKAFYKFASYFTVNISSPNTPGLRDLQTRDQLASLLSRVLEAKQEMIEAGGNAIPIFLKIAPDVAEDDLDDIVAEVLDQKLEGIIVSNTTLDRSALTKTNAESGGLSGKPLFERSTIMLAKTRQRAGKDLAIIGVGGVDSAQTALAKIQAGADLVQLYTGMVYQGPTIANDINRGLSKILDERKIANISMLRDEALDLWAEKSVA
ncbi:Dihydroorotate dehydrogenase (quinone) [Nymphon striatum]|nr:Dihydroorotate dehydrogenase (quinone) [Nymphon striatum]